MPTISVIVPVYKVEPYLRRCVDSILAQTFTDFELILVDDGSPDNCPAICDEYAKQDPRIVVIHKKNGGVSDARNAGLDIAKGDYIGFVDGDDCISPDMYKVLLDRLLQAGADMATCNCLRVDEKLEVLPDQNTVLPIKDDCLTADGFIEKYTEPYGWYYVVVWNKLYRKELFSQIRYPLGRRYEDEFVIHHIAYNCQRIACVQESLYYYIQRVGSFMHQQFSVENMDLGEVLLDQYHFAKSNHHTVLKNYAVQSLAYKMEAWKPLAEKNEACKLKYDELRKKSRFLLYEKSAWGDYSLKGKIYHRLELLAPGFAQGIRRRLHLGSLM